MTNRERFMNTITGKKIDRLPFFFHFGPWPETIKRWREEGMTGQWHGGFYDGMGFDLGIRHVDVKLGYFPAFEYTVLEEKENTRIIIDSLGIKQEIAKASSIPRYIDYPVKNRSDWETLKERLNPDDAGRFPSNWDALADAYNKEDYIMQLGHFPYGLFGTLRDAMGVEELCCAFYEDPELVHEMMETFTDLWLSIYEKVCRDVKVDVIHMWEDMSGKNGSLISPAMVREFMMPCYKRIAAFANAHGIPVFSLDTDGDCSELVPLFIESGINMIFPFEVAAGSDVVDYRKKYPKLGIMGGINKNEIAKGRDAIDRELERLAPMFKKNPYIAMLDHLIPPEISWDDFNYFVEKLRDIIMHPHFSEAT